MQDINPIEDKISKWSEILLELEKIENPDIEQKKYIAKCKTIISLLQIMKKNIDDNTKV